MLKKFLQKLFIIFFIVTIYANFVNYSIYISMENSSEDSQNENTENNSYFVSTSDTFFWPIPGFHNITSPFGTRISPITKKPSNHSGIDIGAIEGSLLYSIHDGIVKFIGFNGANGYSIHILSNNLEFIYGHVSPNYIVSKRSKSNDWANNSELLVQNMLLHHLITLIKILLVKQQTVLPLVHIYI